MSLQCQTQHLIRIRIRTRAERGPPLPRDVRPGLGCPFEARQQGPRLCGIYASGPDVSIRYISEECERCNGAKLTILAAPRAGPVCPLPSAWFMQGRRRRDTDRLLPSAQRDKQLPQQLCRLLMP